MPKIVLDTKQAIPNDESRIAEVEKTIGARLPEDYRQYLLMANGVQPYISGYEDCYIFVRVTWSDNAPGKVTGDEQLLNSPGCLLEDWPNKNSGYTNDLRWTLANVEKLPKDFIAIWDDPGASLFLLGIRKHNFGKVFYQEKGFFQLQSNGNAVEESLAFVANTFTEFLQMLEPAPDDWDLWEAAGKPKLPLTTEELEALARQRKEAEMAKPLENLNQTNFSADKVRGARK